MRYTFLLCLLFVGCRSREPDARADASALARPDANGAAAADALSDPTAALTAPAVVVPSAPDASRPRIVDALNRFAFDLYAHVVEPGENLIISPPSVAFGLSLVMAGARGSTRAQIAGTLHVDGVPQAPEGLAAVMAKLNTTGGTDGVVLHVDNRLWGQRGLPFSPTFLSSLLGGYPASFETVDFGDPSAACITINTWVSEQTHGRITEFLAPNTIDSDTRLLIATAVYLKAAWQEPFQERATVDDEFTSPAGAVRVKMMRARETLAYADIPGGKAVEIPFRNGLSMDIILPDSSAGIGELERRFGRQCRLLLAQGLATPGAIPAAPGHFATRS